MNIKTLHVQNFKNFEDKTFEFGEGFNLIIGDNGTGKTAVLELISYFLNNFINIIGNEVDKNQNLRDFVRILGINQGETFTLEEQLPANLSTEFTINELLTNTSQSFDSQNNNSEYQNYNNRAKFVQIVQNLASEVRVGQEVIIPIISYYGTGRLWSQEQDLNREPEQVTPFEELILLPGSRFDGYKNALKIAINKQWLGWLAREELVSLQRREPRKVYTAVKNAIQSCLDGCEQMYFDFARFELIVQIRGKVLPFKLLSDGQRSMLAMVADIAYRMAQLNPHLLEKVTLETPGVVLIDELDLHLHPKWQRTIVDNLRKTFPKVQFIATSHSPFIIQSLRPGELIDLNDVAGAAQFQNQSIEDIVEKVQGVELPQHSERLQKMYKAAKDYFTVLEQAKNTDSAELERLKTELDRLSMPFSDDVAYHAFLEMERLAALKELA
jgi:predicted ATP-binding protein involved in virulence